MKKIYLLIYTIFLFTSVGYAQKKDSSIERIIWDNNANCSDLILPSVRNESLQCFEQKWEGAVYYIIYYNNISCAISFESYDNKIIKGTVQINNNSGKPVFIDVKKSYISDYASKDSFRKNEKSKSSENALSAKKIVDKILYGVNPASISGSSSVPNAAPNAGLRATTRISTEGASQGMTVIEPTSPQSNPTNVIDRRDPAMNSGGKYGTTVTAQRGKKPTRYDQMIKNALVSKSLNDKGKAAGSLYFKRFKNAGFRAVFVRIGDLEFVFPSS